MNSGRIWGRTVCCGFKPILEEPLGLGQNQEADCKPFVSGIAADLRPLSLGSFVLQKPEAASSDEQSLAQLQLTFQNSLLR